MRNIFIFIFILLSSISLAQTGQVPDANGMTPFMYNAAFSSDPIKFVGKRVYINNQPIEIRCDPPNHLKCLNVVIRTSVAPFGNEDLCAVDSITRGVYVKFFDGVTQEPGLWTYYSEISKNLDSVTQHCSIVLKP
jgi:hypothetical protein